MTNKQGGRQSGFMLLEVLVAFVILATSLGVLMHMFSLSLALSGNAAHQQRALSLGEGQLSEALAEPALTPGETRGEFNDLYDWSLKVERFDFPYTPTGESPVAPYRLHLTVSWGDGDTDRVELETIRLQFEEGL